MANEEKFKNRYYTLLLFVAGFSGGIIGSFASGAFFYTMDHHEYFDMFIFFIVAIVIVYIVSVLGLCNLYKKGGLHNGSEGKMNIPKYNRVFVLAGEMEKTNGNYDFLEEDKSGFINGEPRYEAVELLKKHGRVNEIIFVGGPVKNDETKSKADVMKDKMEGNAIALPSEANTKSNIEAIENYLEKNKSNDGTDGLLTQFYHLPRIMRLIKDKKLNLTPICAEAILLAERPSRVKDIKEWYSQPSMVHRIYCEIDGLSDIEKGKYK